MVKEINAYSIQQAFAWMFERDESSDSIPKKLIDITNLDHNDRESIVNILIELNYCVGYCETQPGPNPNQTQSQVIDTVVKGDKKWSTKYVAVYDNPYGNEIVKGSIHSIKKNSVDAARQASETENRDTFVLIGRSPIDFPRCSAQVLYKPSPKQQLGLYKFIW